MDLFIITILMMLSSIFGGYLVYFVFDNLITVNDFAKFFICLIFIVIIFMVFILILSFLRGLFKKHKDKKNDYI